MFTDVVNLIEKRKHKTKLNFIGHHHESPYQPSLHDVLCKNCIFEDNNSAFFVLLGNNVLFPRIITIFMVIHFFCSVHKKESRDQVIRVT